MQFTGPNTSSSFLWTLVVKKRLLVFWALGPFCLMPILRNIPQGTHPFPTNATRQKYIPIKSPLTSIICMMSVCLSVCPVLSRPVPSGPVPSRPVPSRPVPSCPVLSCPVASCPVSLSGCLCLYVCNVCNVCNLCNVCNVCDVCDVMSCNVM